MNNFKKPAHESAIAFIPVRLSSSRLPEKHFKKIGDSSVLEWLIHNLRECENLDEIVIATVAEPANEPLKDFTRQHDLPLFWYEGEIDHVTTRLRLAAEKYQAKICLLISGDCPLVHGPAVDLLIEEFKLSPESDILQVLPDDNKQPPALEGVQIARLKAWQKADELADRPELKEHQFPLLWMRPELFRRHNCRLPKNLYAPRHRFSVDTWADLEFMNRLYALLTERGEPFRLPEVLALLKEKPELLTINEHVHQRKLVDEKHKALFVVDAGGSYGFGHLMRSLELARQLTERKGWPVTFAVDNEEAEQFLLNQGKKTVWAAFQRPIRDKNQDSVLSIQELLPGYNLLVLDIFDQREAEDGWRDKLGTNLAVVVIDNRRPWANEADLIITPGVTANEPGEEPTADNMPKLLAGTDYLILRREIHRQQRVNSARNLDLLVYLHDAQQRLLFSSFAKRHNLKAKVISQFTDRLPQYMAEARIYISGFGISFYESLSLGTLPVCYPDTAAHQRDALRFYRYFGIDPLLIESEEQIETTLLPLLQKQEILVPRCEDGTPRIVAALSELVNGESP